MKNRYKAFISYSHTDERWARWLHRALEHYRLPRDVREKLNLDHSGLRPIFRDRDELASSGCLNTVRNGRRSEYVPVSSVITANRFKHSFQGS